MPISPKDLAAKYAPKAETYRIRLTEDPADDWIARSVSDIREMTGFSKAAEQLLKDSKKGNFPPAWKPYLPLDRTLAYTAVLISSVIVEPQVTQLDILELSRTAGNVVLELQNAIAAQMQISVPTAEEEEIDAAKNDSLPKATT